MSVKRFMTAALAALALPLTASAGSLIIPAAGTGPGANASTWKSEVLVANLSLLPVDVTFVFHDRNGAAGTSTITLPAHTTVSEDDIVATRFGRTSATGAIEIVTADPSKLAVTSRTYNESSTGRFGQDVPAIDAASLEDGAEVLLIGPASVIDQRFNAGIYAVTDAKVAWTLHRADGSTAATVEQTYAAGQQIQYNSAVQSLFGQEAKDLDSFDAIFVSGKGIIYGSAIENESGDPSFARGIATKRESNIHFLGVDRNEDGAVEYPDANHDGITDDAINIATSLFPAFFRVVAESPTGAKITYQILDADPDVTLIDDNGTIEWAPGANRKNSTGTLRVKATAGTDSTILTIKVNFL